MDDNDDTVRQAEKHRATQRQSTARWSKISTRLKHGLTLKNAAQIFRAIAENWASNTHRNREHNEYSA